jgi:hypothetical protein
MRAATRCGPPDGAGRAASRAGRWRCACGGLGARDGGHRREAGLAAAARVGASTSYAMAGGARTRRYPHITRSTSHATHRRPARPTLPTHIAVNVVRAHPRTATRDVAVTDPANLARARHAGSPLRSNPPPRCPQFSDATSRTDTRAIRQLRRVARLMDRRARRLDQPPAHARRRRSRGRVPADPPHAARHRAAVASPPTASRGGPSPARVPLRRRLRGPSGGPGGVRPARRAASRCP